MTHENGIEVVESIGNKEIKSERNDWKFSDPYLEVRIVESNFNLGDGAFLSANRQVIVMEDDAGKPRPVGNVSMKYPLVQNSLARDVMLDVMSRTEHNWLPQRTIWDSNLAGTPGRGGGRLNEMWRTENPIEVISEDRNGETRKHPIHIGLMARNSYDLKSVFGFEMYLVNGYCTNEYICSNRFGSFIMRHTQSSAGQFDIPDALQNISNGMERLIEVAPVLKAMQSKELKVEDIVTARHKLAKLPKACWYDVLGLIDRPTQWELFQALTTVCSHNIKSFRSIDVGNSIGNYFLLNPGKAA